MSPLLAVNLTMSSGPSQKLRCEQWQGGGCPVGASLGSTALLEAKVG